MEERGINNKGEDISRKTILVLIVLTILISIAGVITLLKAMEQKNMQISQQQAQFQQTGDAKVVLTIKNPNINQTQTT